MHVFSYAQEGYDGHIINVEIDVRRGIPSTMIVGLAGHAIQEARERVRIALKNSGFVYPDNRIVINLSPASLPKKGSAFDVAIAYALLAHTAQIAPALHDLMLLGELHLDGTIASVPSVISAVHEGLLHGIKRFVVPAPNYNEACMLGAGTIIPITHLSEVVNILSTKEVREVAHTPAITDISYRPIAINPSSPYTFSHILGHATVKRIIEIAVTGNHHVLFIGAPGSGKTLSAQIMSTLMPALSVEEAIEATRIYSMANALPNDNTLISSAPFRAPHHSISYAAMFGGGDPLRPGEVTLAHNGMLLLDEVLEFRRDVLQGLRQPLEEREIRIARSQRALRFPSDFLLVMTANICPCGNFGRTNGSCFCKLDDIKKYWRRLGGAFLDRIPLRAVVHTEYDTAHEAERHSTDALVTKIKGAIERQGARYRESGIRRNGQLRADSVTKYCALSERQMRAAHAYLVHHQLSHRALHISCAVARTIADLDASPVIRDEHLEEALRLRCGEGDSGARYSHEIVQTLLG